MTNAQKLLAIKWLHTIIWVFFVSIIGYVVYSGFTDTVNIYTWIAICLVVFEGGVLLFFNKSCPLTIWARKYSDSQRDNFDIFLPNWLAKYNKLIFTTIFLIGFALALFRVIV